MLRMIGVMLFLALCFATLAQAAGGDATYRLSAQDKITVTVLRHEELSQSYTIPPDGIVDFPRAGRINVIGKTTTEVAASLTEQLGKVLRDPDVSVMLVTARTRYAYVLGAVTKSGQFPIFDGTRITELLAAAGDLAGDRIGMTAKLVRGTTTLPVQLQAALSGKDPAANMTIQEGDLLWIEEPPRITVVISGMVKNPGAQKLRVGSTLVDAMAAAGDLIERTDRVHITLQRGNKALPLTWGDTTTVLQDGDVILIEKEKLARIYVDGQVKNPGAYDLPPGGGVLEALALAGGTVGSPALGQITIKRANGDKEQVNMMPAIIRGEITENPRLQPEDYVIVPVSNKRFSVMGMVNNPGTFPFDDSKPLTVTDAIAMAGGNQKRAKLSQTFVIRVVDGKPTQIKVDVVAILEKGKQDLNIPLQASDIVYIPPSKSPSLSGLLQSFYQLGILATVL